MKHDNNVGSVIDKKTPLDVPNHVIESFARCLLPAIHEYFDSEEGQREFAKWKLDESRNR